MNKMEKPSQAKIGDHTSNGSLFSKNKKQHISLFDPAGVRQLFERVSSLFFMSFYSFIQDEEYNRRNGQESLKEPFDVCVQ